MTETKQNIKARAVQSKEKLKDEIGELLFFLQGNITQSQREAGWELFEEMLTKYLADKWGL